MKKVLAIVLALVMVFSFAACGKKQSDGYKITVWCSEVEGVKDLFAERIAKFAEENDVKISATVEGVSESDAATQMITSVEDGADIFCFAQDQLARLVQAGALAKLGDATAATVKELNSPGSVANASLDGNLYCYPLTDDNGYFMYYDKSVIPEEDLGSFEKLIEDCEKAGKNFSFQLTTSGWYNASFFFATGCVCNYVFDGDGNVITSTDTYNSDAGVIALKGMQKLLKSGAFTASEAGTADFTAAIPSAIVVSGTWDYNTAAEALGDNLGATKLPSFTVDGQTYQLGSFNGCKLLGVKPTTDTDKAALLQKLALYLTNEESQLEIYNKFNWGPSNKAAQESEAVKSNPGLMALAEQNVFATPQGQYPGNWWNVTKSPAVAAQKATTDAELKQALQEYDDAIKAGLAASGYIFVGAWNGWDNADGTMKLQGEGNVYSITVNVEKSDYMGGRIVKASSWDTDKGCTIVTEGKELISEDGGSDNNIVFLEPGTYEVTFDEGAMTIKIVKK